MHAIARTLLILACVAHASGTLAAVQRGALRASVRERGKIEQYMMCCGPIVGVKEIVQLSQVTVQGIVSRADSALREDDRDEYVYTDYVVDVSRTFRMPAFTSRAPTSGSSTPWPFITDGPATRRGANPPRMRLRVTFQGTVQVEGGTITASRNFPALRVGQHVILSAYYCKDLGQWAPIGVFEVRDQRVVRLEERLERDYASVEEFAKALANPPETAGR